MKKILMIIFLCVFTASLSVACSKSIYTQPESSQQSTQNHEPIIRDVVFLNMFEEIGRNTIYVGGTVFEKVKQNTANEYIYNEETDKDTLYAYRLFIYPDEGLKPYETMKKEGIYIVKDYPEEMSHYYECVIAATMDDLVRVFDGEDSVMNGVAYELTPATRIDMIQIFREIGWSEEIDPLFTQWFQIKKKYVQKYIGTEPHVVLSVELE